MHASHVFQLVNLTVLPIWGLLILAPRWQRTQYLASRVVPYSLGLAYVAIMAVALPSSAGGFTTLEGVAECFANPWVLLAGWVHYLAFDLFVGSWIVRDAQRRGIRHGWVIPSLMLTFLLGPTGWVVYIATRKACRISTNGIEHRGETR